MYIIENLLGQISTLLCIGFENLCFHLLAKKAGFGYDKEQIEELVSRKVVEFIFKLVIIEALYRIVVQVI